MRYQNAPAHIRAAINAQADRWTTTTGEPLTNFLQCMICQECAEAGLDEFGRCRVCRKQEMSD